MIVHKVLGEQLRRGAARDLEHIAKARTRADLNGVLSDEDVRENVPNELTRGREGLEVSNRR